MDYLWLKALHIVLVITWIGGMLTVAGATAAYADNTEASRQAEFFGKIRKWDQRITTPAMLGVWVLGLTLSGVGQWFPQPWLVAKIALVLVLSGLHGMLSGRLRRLATGQSSTGTISHLGYVAIIGLVFVVVVLVVIKPF